MPNNLVYNYLFYQMQCQKGGRAQNDCSARAASQSGLAYGPR